MDRGLRDLKRLGTLIHFQIICRGVTRSGTNIFVHHGTFQIQIRGAANLADGTALGVHLLVDLDQA